MFKVGDQAKVVKILPGEDDDISLRVGQVGLVTKVTMGACYPVQVDLPGGQAYFAEEELVFTPGVGVGGESL